MPQSLFAHIDLYCERLEPGHWAEPVNALSNLVIVIAGLWGVHEVRRNGTGTFAEVLAWWVVAVGIGSGLFHTFANYLTIWADIIPIATIVLVYTVFALRRFIGLDWAPTALVFVVFYAVAGFLTYLVPDWIRIATNGSSGYLPALLSLLFIGGWTWLRGSPAWPYCFIAAVLFLCAVTFRILDLQVCETFPIGTHFLWHTFNGLLLGVLIAAVARHGAPRSPVVR